MTMWISSPAGTLVSICFRKPRELGGTVARLTFANDEAAGHIQRREQGARAKANIVVNSPLGHARIIDKTGCSRSSAWIWLFSSTQYQGAVGR